ncbi:hypothetical protein JCM19233_19 [Vibrio astriarenae]|nr:hypothetical protein JCM19233_19 [Vibrio sp. C7]
MFCRRLDRMRVPILSGLISLLTLGQLKLKFPKLHIGIVKYGDNANSLTVDKWHLWGSDLYASYDTKQSFSDSYDKGTYTVLPPYYTHGRYAVPYTLRNIMRLTKIHFRKYSRVFAFSVGLVVAAVSTYLLIPYLPQSFEPQITQGDQAKPEIDLKGFKIVSYMRTPNEPLYFELDKKGVRLTSLQLASSGYTFSSDSRCNVQLIKGASYETITC